MSRKHSKRKKNYPHNWDRASLAIRRLANGCCEWCHTPCDHLSVHHIGAKRPNGRGWKNGNPCDKHDLRRENLVALCWTCHSAADEPLRQKITAKRAKTAASRKEKRERHAALGIGTGLIPYTSYAAA